MKLQKGIINNNGEEQVVICEVSNEDKPEVIIGLFNTWNNKFVADHIIEAIAEWEDNHS